MSGGKNFFSRTIAVVVASMMLTACSSNEVETIEEIIEQDQTEITEPALNVSYEVPVVTPGIVIDQYGYEPDAEKIAIFRGENIADTFEVRDLETDKVVYTGEVRRSKYNKELEEYDSCGYFTDFETEGNYYIYNETLGSSYAFSIKKDIYTELSALSSKVFYLNRCGFTLMEEYAGENAHAACHTDMATLQEDSSVEIDVTGGWHLDEKANRDVVEGCNIAQNLLLAYELNPDAFSDETNIPESGDGVADILNEIKVEVDWLLKMQDSKTGGVYSSALTKLTGTEDLYYADVYVTPITMEATISFSALLAKFSYIYQSMDSQYATECLRAADRAWKCYIKNEDAGESSLCFLAAAELYRATGADSYKSVLDTYFEKEDFLDAFVSDDATFLGGITYISTKQDVDKTTCTGIMNALMKKSEEIATSSNSSTFYISASFDEDMLDTIFDNIRYLTVTDYIIYNHEYTTIIENHVHFLLGANPSAMNYVTDSTEYTYINDENVGTILSNPVYVAKFILMLSLLS